MELIEIKTLIDITNTQVVRLNQGSQLQLDQNRNFITLSQCIELRSVVYYNRKPTCETIDLKNLEFGTAYKGKHKVWTFIFSPDRDGVYLDDQNNNIGILFDDIHEVPIIKNLSETINIDKAIFDVKDKSYKNIIINMQVNTNQE